MTRIIPFRRDEHQETQLLLPWYAKGSLDAAETARVEAHLAGCEACAAELEMERELAGELAELTQDAEGGWARLRGRMAQAPRRTPSRRVAAGGAIAAALALGAVLGVFSLRTLEAPRYQTLGSPTPAAAGSVVVIFRPDAREQDLRRILVGAHARLVDGPTEAGAYVLAASSNDPSAALAFLRQQPQVVLAQPIEAGSRP